ncbi:hypothetical protein [Croceicoccus marinus]|uniref:Uncharacterized protein n=1 Tax=Croceicoccus marinus TaxID=450378 RepID=A0A7G6VU27_9SPHN|nr:hypothetical protein [Croceicoccus marinus]QNE05242.1 hypothetical protein H4O24_00515 [Croceicoccus marinus]
MAIAATFSISLGSCTTQSSRDAELKAAIAAADAAKESAAKTAGESEYADAMQSMPMGAVCWAAILEAVSSYGQRCIADESEDFRAALDEARLRLDRKFLGSAWSEERLAAFKRQMGEADTPKAELCSNADALGIYRETEKPGSEWLFKITDDLVSRPGPPEWGTCF